MKDRKAKKSRQIAFVILLLGLLAMLLFVARRSARTARETGQEPDSSAWVQTVPAEAGERF